MSEDKKLMVRVLFQNAEEKEIGCDVSAEEYSTIEKMKSKEMFEYLKKRLVETHLLPSYCSGIRDKDTTEPEPAPELEKLKAEIRESFVEFKKKLITDVMTAIVPLVEEKVCLIASAKIGEHFQQSPHSI